MVRAPCCEKMGLKKGPWTPEEDQILTSFINAYGHGNWRALPKQAGLLRCGKSCRLRWINYLRPDIKRGNFTREEEDTIIKLHEMLGNRWSAIAARLPGRTDNEIKNVWHTHLKKRLNKNNTYNNIIKDQSAEVTLAKDKFSAKQRQMMRTASAANTVVTGQSEPTSSNMSSQSYSSDLTSITEASSIGVDHKANNKNETDEDVVIVMEEINNMECQFSESTNYFAEIDESFWSEALSTKNSDVIIPLEFLDAPSEIFQTSQDNIGHDMEFWYDIFVKAGGSPKLPEF